MTGDGGLVEVQATAERTPLSRAHLDELLALAAAAASRACARSQAAAVALSAAVRLVLATRNAHKLREFERLLPRRRARAAARRRRAAARGDRRHVRRQRADQGARRGRGDRARRRSPTTPGSRPRRSAARPACARARYAGEDATDGENLAKLRARGARRQPRCATCACSPTSTPGRRRAPVRGHAATGTLRREPRGERRLRLRPGVRPRRRRRRPHDGRADRRREGRDLPPRPRRAGAARHGSSALTGDGAATSRPAARARGASRSSPTRALIAAQDRRRRGHRLGRDPHRGDPLGDRPARLAHRVLLRPPGRGARRRRRTATATRSSRTSPRRSRGC